MPVIERMAESGRIARPEGEREMNYKCQQEYWDEDTQALKTCGAPAEVRMTWRNPDGSIEFQLLCHECKIIALAPPETKAEERIAATIKLTRLA